jgi:pimeloyl-ACP methyl ester carboxylesterase
MLEQRRMIVSFIKLFSIYMDILIIIFSKQQIFSSSEILFFSDHLCLQFLEHGYDFFALDLRKCGRSIISPEQDHYKHYCNDLHEYDEEITLSIEHIIKEAKTKIKKLILLGHSTGNKVRT